MTDEEMRRVKKSIDILLEQGVLAAKEDDDELLPLGLAFILVEEARRKGTTLGQFLSMMEHLFDGNMEAACRAQN
jgi:hypothetical protein